ncbi:branched-chain amino acid ABC transporter permease, partial [Thermodesulfobacteriota bacterium]
MLTEGTAYFLQTFISGLSIGSLYAIVALGFVLIFKATDVINFAQGELMMVGAYFCFYLITAFQIPYVPAFLMTLIFSALLGIIIEVLILRPMVGQPIFAVVMVVIGLASVMKGLVVFIWGASFHRFPSPLTEKFFSFGDFNIFQSHIFTLLTVLCLVVIFSLFFKYSMTGIAMRATSQDQDTALLMGISVIRKAGT